MLTQLTINNFAIVRHLDIELFQGMSAITGETGAGKSIALDALGLCLGSRTETTMLRDANQRAEVCATFKLTENLPALQWLQAHELQDNENPQECILRRIVNSDGRSKAYINNTPVSASQLKELGQCLVHISGQHASQLLLKADYQLQLLDNFSAHNDLLHQMRKDYSAWKTIQQKVKQFKQQQAENEARKQLLQYQVEELDEFDLKIGEYEELESEHSRLSNSEELTSLSQGLLNVLSENEEANIDSMLYRASKYIDDLAALDSRYSDIQGMLQDALIQVQEATSEVYHLANNIEQDPHALQEVEARMSKTISLARKHNVAPEELASYHQRLTQELSQLMEFSDSEDSLLEAENKAHEQMLQSARQLSASRRQSAVKLAKEVTKSIKHLAMENAEFFVEIQSDLTKVDINGADSAIFTLRSNLGQAAQSLTKVASGGELSRIALVIQVLTTDKSSIPTLIFDEIDVGISGATASVVGKLLRKLGQKCQVLCVTHLPQVACAAHHHFWVEKSVVDNKTETNMTALSNQQRVKALARLLGGQKITENVLANAEEMLALAS
ncbi:DNA replication and repair protein RecN [Cricetibacter osteomyelitidis]|uniref:DNA repair protein RecN n=1 Tax=Cricetibacter osteomyelitidis TaxID=1521931 RepID=A0A4R2T5L4_9PAST|nr:DNA repair protein RecN [Cricetibacter osteomyelitidis]TCP97720.1 DNA replication and repair protein RecN [Cricetibacter osteomyelitidis]